MDRNRTRYLSVTVLDDGASEKGTILIRARVPHGTRIASLDTPIDSVLHGQRMCTTRRT